MKQGDRSKVTADVPFYFAVARALYTLLDGYRGQYFFYRLLGRLGLLRQAGRFKFFDGRIHIPLDIPETLFITDFSLFEGLREINFANTIHRALSNGATLIDCGAAFGQVSCRIAKLCPNIGSIIAIEPNEANRIYLRENLKTLDGKSTRLVSSAVSSFRGKGKLCFPKGEGDTHSAYIEKSDTGEIDVTTVDDLLPELTGDVAMKLDVEGAELDVIAGAARTILGAKNICFFVEIHPEVLARNRAKGEDLLMAINSVRETRWFIADAPMTAIDPHRPFFEQVEAGIYDVIGVSTTTTDTPATA